MKKILVLILCMFLIIQGCEKYSLLDERGTSPLNDAEAGIESGIQSKEHIVYARFGAQKGIFCTDISGKNINKIYDKEYDKASGLSQNIILYTRYEGVDGIYQLKLSDEQPKLILKGFALDSKPSVSSDGTATVFLGHNLKDHVTKAVFVSLQNSDVQILDIKGEIKDIALFDKDNIVYSKKINSGDNEIFQIFKYSIKEKVETRLVSSSSNDINPIISPDRKSIAFLSDKNKRYNLYILNLYDNTINSIDMKDAVIGGTLSWSGDNNYIVCVTLNGGSRDKIKLADVGSKTVEDIDKGYIAIFSNDGRYLIYASYDPNQEAKKQIIYKRKVTEKTSEQIIEFPEEGKYSKSINMLYTVGF